LVQYIHFEAQVKVTGQMVAQYVEQQMDNSMKGFESIAAIERIVRVKSLEFRYMVAAQNMVYRDREQGELATRR
jgi:hypothetical protein